MAAAAWRNLSPASKWRKSGGTACKHQRKINLGWRWRKMKKEGEKPKWTTETPLGKATSSIWHLP